MFSSKYRNYILLFVYVLFFAHAAIWYSLGYEKIGHLGFGEPFIALKTGVVSAGVVFTLLVFLHAFIFGGWFCGWLCHWGITQDFAAGIMKRLGIKPLMIKFNTKLIPLMWFCIMIAQVVFYWVYEGFPASISVNLGVTPVWTAVPRSIFMICITTLVSCFLLIFLFGERAFCRGVCVFRLWFSWFERLAPHKIRQIAECKACTGDCALICPMGIEVDKEIKILGQIKNQECIKCNLCVAACPHGVLKPSLKKTGFEKSACLPSGPKTFSNSVKILQLSCTIIIVVFFGFTIGGNMTLSLGLIAGTLLACLCVKHRLSLLTWLLIAVLPVCFYYANDLNDISSLIKGLALLTVFLFAAKKLGFKNEVEFISTEASKPAVMPLAIIVLIAALIFGVREMGYSLQIHKANAALLKGDKQTYARVMQKCASHHISPAMAYFDLARVNLALNELKQAEQNFISSLKASYTPEASDSIIALCYFGGCYEQCANIAKWLFSRHPENYKYPMAVGRCLLEQGKYKEAEKAFETALALSSQNADVMILLAQTKYENNDAKAAKNMFEKAFAINPALTAPYMAEYFAETPEQAEEYYTKALKTAPNNAELLMGLGDCLSAQGRLKKAINTYKKIEPNSESYIEVKNKIMQAQKELQAQKDAILGIKPK